MTHGVGVPTSQGAQKHVKCNQGQELHGRSQRGSKMREEPVQHHSETGGAARC